MNNSLDDLLKTTSALTANLSAALTGLEITMQEAIKAVPDEHKHRTQEAANICTQAINMAKNGNSAGINDLIKNFKDGSKSNQ